MVINELGERLDAKRWPMEAAPKAVRGLGTADLHRGWRAQRASGKALRSKSTKPKRELNE